MPPVMKVGYSIPSAPGASEGGSTIVERPVGIWA